jgi:hypothetical protein
VSRFPLTPLPTAGILAEIGRWLPVEVHAPVPFQLVGMHVPNRDTSRRSGASIQATVPGSSRAPDDPEGASRSIAAPFSRPALTPHGAAQLT